MPLKNPEAKKAYESNYRKKNRQAYNDRIRNWRTKNPEKKKNSDVKYKEAHPKRWLLIQAKSRAKKKGIEYSIEESDITIPECCPILGFPLYKNKGNTACDNSPTLDRIDSTKGYVKGNVWVISYRANRIKSDATIEELELIASVVRNKLLEQNNAQWI